MTASASRRRHAGFGSDAASELLVDGGGPDLELDVEDSLAAQVDLGDALRRVPRPLDRRARALEEGRVLAREGRQMRAPHLLLALHHEPEAHGEAADDLADRGLRERLRRGISLRVGHSAREELPVLNDRVERRAPPLLERVHRLHVVVVVEDERRSARGAGDLADHQRRPARHVHQSDLNAVALEERPRGVGALGLGLPPRADRRHARVRPQLLDEVVEPAVDPRVHVLPGGPVDAVGHEMASSGMGRGVT
jgi:hypothetical protein